MSTVKIDYDKLNAISKNASKAASKMQDYIDDLSKKVANKYSGITGGASSRTSSSEYYTNQKISQLQKKKSYYSTFSKAISTFSSDAQEIDKEVAKKIRASKNEFIDKHDYINVDWWTELKNFFIELKNACPLFNVIGELIEDTLEGMKTLCEEIKYWYKCGGGKELVGCVLAIVGAVAAIVLAVIACVPPISGIVAVCAAVAAVITAINSVVNVVTAFKAKKAKDNGDPAWAKIYGERDTAQDVLRQTNFKDGFLNKLSFAGAMLIDCVELVCSAVDFADSVRDVHKVFKEIKRYSQRSQTRNFAQVLKSYVFNEKNYKGLKLRDYIQKRALKPKTLTPADKFAKSLQKASKYAQKGFDYFVDGKFSGKDLLIDVADTVLADFKIKDSFDKAKDLYTQSVKSIMKNYRGFRGFKAVTPAKGGSRF